MSLERPRMPIAIPRSATTVFLFFLLAAAAGLAGPPPPVDGPFRVNSSTAGDQSAPDVDAAGDGFVVVWEDSLVTKTLFQRFDEGAAAVGDETQVDPTSELFGREPRVDMGPGGDFVVLMRSFVDGTLGGSRLLHAQPFDSGGQPTLPSIPIYQTFTGLDGIHGHGIGLTQAGEWVTAYAYSDGYGVFGRVQTQRHLNGNSLGTATLGTNTEDFYRVSLGQGPGDSYLVAWQVIEGPGSFSDGAVEARRVDAFGVPTSGVIEIASGEDFFDGTGVATALDPAGGFLAVWGAADRATGTALVTDDVWARYIDSAGTPTGPPLRVNTFTAGLQRAPQVARGSDGTFLVVWEGEGSGGSDSEGLAVNGRRLNARGHPMGSEFQVNVATAGDQHQPRVEAGEAGETFVVAWTSDSAATGEDIWARRYLADLVHGDGFESGDTSAWATASP